MPVEIHITYEGDLHCHLIHGPSNVALKSDAPTDNGGKGASFSPTDLVAAALGSCMITTMGILAKRHQMDIAGTQVHVIKEMISQPSRRIGALPVTITIPRDKAAKLSAEDRQRLERAGMECPVMKTLSPEVQTPVKFVYET